MEDGELSSDGNMRAKEQDSFFIRAPRMNKYQILKELGADSRLTQAELARRCGLSVAMVNNYIKELAALGFLEYRRRNSKSVTYHLTGSGEQKVESLETGLIHEMADRLDEAKQRVADALLTQVQGRFRKVVLAGTGALGKLVFHALESAGISVIGVCDAEGPRQGRTWCGRKVYEPSEVARAGPDAVVIADAGLPKKILSILQNLPAAGIAVVDLGARPMKAVFPDSPDESCPHGPGARHAGLPHACSGCGRH